MVDLVDFCVSFGENLPSAQLFLLKNTGLFEM